MRILLPVEARNRLIKEITLLKLIKGPRTRSQEIDKAIDQLRKDYPECFHKDK